MSTRHLIYDSRNYIVFIDRDLCCVSSVTSTIVEITLSL